MRYYAEYSTFASTTAGLDTDIQDSADWTINNPAGTDAEVGSVTHNPTKTTYTIAADGTVTP
jgi:hypothetical protein